MSVSTRIRVFIVALLAVVAMTALPSTAEAQRRYRRPVRVVFIGTFGYYPYWLHDPWYRWRPYPGPTIKTFRTLLPRGLHPSIPPETSSRGARTVSAA